MARAKTVGPTQQERALADVSTAQWNDYLERYRPAEMQLMRLVKETKGKIAQAGGQASADTAGAFMGSDRAAQQVGSYAGGAAAGKTKMSLAADALKQGDIKGMGKALAETGVKEHANQMGVKVTAYGRGLAADVTQDMAHGARRATSLAMAAAAAKQERNEAMIDAASSVAGAAYSKYKIEQEKKLAETNKRVRDKIKNSPKVLDKDYMNQQPGILRGSDHYGLIESNPYGGWRD